MAVDNVSCPFVFVIDTSEYAGNFEREMCAYMTGQIGDCEVGKKSVPIFVEEEGEELQDEIGSFMSWQSDDHGCARPTSIWQSPGKFSKYDSVAIFFDEEPTPEIIEVLKRRAEAFSKKKHKWINPFKVKGFRLVNIVRIVTEREV